MEKKPQEQVLTCIDHEEECIMYCKDDRCMFPLMCSKCLETHEKEYRESQHQIEKIETIFDSESLKQEFIQDYNKQMKAIERDTKEKQEVLKGAYSEFTTQVIQACHRYYINNNIDNVLENLRNEFEMSKAEYQIQMNPNTLKKMAEDYLRLRKVDEAIKHNSEYIMTKEEIFQNIENELENLNGHVTNKLSNLEKEYKKQLLNIVDYDIEKHLELLMNEENEHQEIEGDDDDRPSLDLEEND